MSKIISKWIGEDEVKAVNINPDVAGDGLEQGGSGELKVKPDATGGANLARSIAVGANGTAVKIDDDTIKEDGSQQLSVGPNSIGANEVDETDTYNWSGTHDFQSGTIHVATPSSDTHAVTKAYADALRSGAKHKDPCRALANSNQTLSGLPSNIDGVTGWSAGDRVLLIAQTAPAENGIWEVQVGSWTRPSDFDTGDGASGAQTWIDQGATYGESQWTCTTDEPNDIIDTNSLTFVQTSGAGQITAGTGLTKSGNTIHIGDGSTGDKNGINRQADEISAAVDDVTVEVASHQIRVKDGGIGEAKLAAQAATAAKLGADVAGEGLSGGAGAAIDLDVNGLVEDSAPDNADFLVFWDVTEGVHNKVKKSDLLAGSSSEQIKHEMHKITAGEVSAGYFTVSESPTNAQSVRVRVYQGITQVNKQVVGATGATPDFDVLNTNQLHFNNNGAATGLSGDMGEDDILVIEYHY